jgi:hypothetical protein
MIKKVLSIVAVSAAVVCFSCCSGDGGKVSNNGIFGELPAVADDYNQKCIDLLNNLQNSESKEEALKQLMIQSKQLDSMATVNFKAVIDTWADKTFPTEVAEGVPFKIISDFKYNPDRSKDDRLYFRAEIERTAKTGMGEGEYRLNHARVMFVDKDGNPLCTTNETLMYTLEEDWKKSSEPGSKSEVFTDIVFSKWNAEWLSKAAKFYIADSETDFYKLAKDTTKNAEKAYKQYIKDLGQQLTDKFK